MRTSHPTLPRAPLAFPAALALLAPLLLAACPDGTSLVICTPTDRLCRDGAALVCSPEGTSWSVDECTDAEVCMDGACSAIDPELLTEVLPPGVVGAQYEVVFEVQAGTAPLLFTLAGGDVPDGLALDPDAGNLAGVPEAPGDFVFGVAVIDAENGADERQYSLTIHPEPVTVLTPEYLGAVDEGLPMSVPLEAEGGVLPYGWFLVEGALPVGVGVNATGVLDGTPEEPGRFEFAMRVVDSQDPPGFGEADFVLDVSLRPLRIVGQNSFEILGFSIVTLPLLTIIPGIPLPYSAQLEATGGLRPYDWRELPIPPALGTFIPTGGIPANLVLQPDGLITGSVTDTSQVITLGIPFTGIELTGYFFFAEVADAQLPAETAQAMFLIPTLPIAVP